MWEKIKDNNEVSRNMTDQTTESNNTSRELHMQLAKLGRTAVVVTDEVTSPVDNKKCENEIIRIPTSMPLQIARLNRQ